MRKSIFFYGLFISLAFLASCDRETIRVSDEITSREFSFSDYSGLNVGSAFNVFVTFSDSEERIQIEANENLQDRIVVQKEGNELSIRLRKNTNVRGNATLNAYITTKSLSSIDLSGATDLVFENEWISKDARVGLSGASRLSGALTSNELQVDQSGDSTIEFYGQVTDLDAKLSGSSEILDYDLLVQRLNLELSGSSDAFLTVEETIDIRASGASVLRYKGGAVVKKKELSGDSKVTQK